MNYTYSIRTKEKQEIPVWGTPCLTYRVWIFQGASGRVHPVLAFSPLVRSSQPRSANILPVHRRESVQHTQEGHYR